jgi:hypothetical protein
MEEKGKSEGNGAGLTEKIYGNLIFHGVALPELTPKAFEKECWRTVGLGLRNEVIFSELSAESTN